MNHSFALNDGPGEFANLEIRRNLPFRFLLSFQWSKSTEAYGPEGFWRLLAN